jgi:hypothetical protein
VPQAGRRPAAVAVGQDATLGGEDDRGQHRGLSGTRPGVEDGGSVGERQPEPLGGQVRGIEPGREPPCRSRAGDSRFPSESLRPLVGVMAPGAAESDEWGLLKQPQTDGEGNGGYFT